MKGHAALIWGLILAAITALGSIKTLLAISTGSDFGLQKVGFYVGATAIFIYFGVFLAFIVTGTIFTVARLLLGEERSGEVEGTLVWPVLFIAGALGLWFAGSLVFSGWLVYEDTDAFGRGFFALIGLGFLGWTIYMLRKTSKPQETNP